MDLTNPLPFSAFREDFPILKTQVNGKPLIYFDTAATAQKPQAVIDRMSRFYQYEYGTVHRAVYALSLQSTESYQKVRDQVREFLNAKQSGEIIFTRGTTEAINLVAHSFGKRFVKPGSQVVLSQMEHHSNIVPWQLMCEDRGASLQVIPMNDQGELDLDAYGRLLSEKTVIVSVTHISNSLGTVNPLKKIIAMAHEAGAKVLIDGAQAAPHIPLDVQDLDADFYAFSGHKMYGPTGIGILYGKQHLLEAMPPYQGGGDMIQTVAFDNTLYNDPPLKFEAGTPMIAEVIGLGAAIDYLNGIGLERIETREQELLAYATEQLQQIEGLRIIGTAAKKGAIISFVVDGIHPLDLGTMLDLEGIAVRTGHHCTQPAMSHFGIPGTTRLSFAFYNTKEEIDFFAAATKKMMKKLCV
ncbi:MAG: cysteine desulfurase [Waddliaceae bacterium]